MYHPTIYHFLDVLNRGDSMARVSIVEALGRHQTPPVRQRYIVEALGRHQTPPVRQRYIN